MVIRAIKVIRETVLRDYSVFSSVKTWYVYVYVCMYMYMYITVLTCIGEALLKVIKTLRPIRERVCLE